MHPVKLREGFRECTSLPLPVPHRGKEADSGMPSSSLIGRRALYTVVASTGPSGQILHAEGERRGARGEAPLFRRRELGRVQGAGGGAANAQGEHPDFPLTVYVFSLLISNFTFRTSWAKNERKQASLKFTNGLRNRKDIMTSAKFPSFLEGDDASDERSGKAAAGAGEGAKNLKTELSELQVQFVDAINELEKTRSLLRVQVWRCAQFWALAWIVK